VSAGRQCKKLTWAFARVVQGAGEFTAPDARQAAPIAGDDQREVWERPLE